MGERWMSELRTHSFGWCLITTSECGGVAALRLSARMVQNVAIRVLMACDESSAECAAARAIRKAVRYLWVICAGRAQSRRAPRASGDRTRSYNIIDFSAPPSVRQPPYRDR